MEDDRPDILFRWGVILSVLLHVGAYLVLQLEFAEPQEFDAGAGEVSLISEAELAELVATPEVAEAEPVPVPEPQPVEQAVDEQAAPVAPEVTAPIPEPAPENIAAETPPVSPEIAPEEIAPEEVTPEVPEPATRPEVSSEVSSEVAPEIPSENLPEPEPVETEAAPAVEESQAAKIDPNNVPRPRRAPERPAPRPEPPKAPAPESENKPKENIGSLADRLQKKLSGGRSSSGGGGGSELAGKINAQMARCWREPDGAPDPERLAVVVSFNLSRDGRLVGRPQIVDGPPSSEPFADQAMRNAILAVEKCSPLRDLPIELYNEWRRVEVKFEPGMGR